MVEVIGAAVALVAVKAGTFVAPDAPRPIAVFEFVQAMVAPAGVLVNVCEAMAVPAHTEILAGAVITGFGFTVTVTVDVQLVEGVVAVTVYVPDAAVVGLAIDGFCVVAVKLFGPVQA